MKTPILAHRGAAAYAPENTLSAFALALEMGADGLELDIHLSKDGQIVVTHDEDIRRVSDAEGQVSAFSYNELKEFDFAAKSPHRRGRERLPLLSDVLELLRGKSLTLNIELKNSVVLYPEIEEKALRLVRDLNMEEQILFSSFNHYSIVKLKHQLKTAAPCGLLYGEPLFDPWAYAAHAKVDALHPHFGNLIIPNYVKNCHTLALKVHPWTVDQEEDIRRVLLAGADALITNRPDVALAIRSQL